VPPEQILDSWTEEKFLLLLKKRNERTKRMQPAAEPKIKRVSDVDLFRSMGVTPNVVRIN
jgi:hypothetical protein